MKIKSLSLMFLLLFTIGSHTPVFAMDPQGDGGFVASFVASVKEHLSNPALWVVLAGTMATQYLYAAAGETARTHTSELGKLVKKCTNLVGLTTPEYPLENAKKEFMIMQAARAAGNQDIIAHKQVELLKNCLDTKNLDDIAALAQTTGFDNYSQFLFCCSLAKANKNLGLPSTCDCEIPGDMVALLLADYPGGKKLMQKLADLTAKPSSDLVLSSELDDKNSTDNFFDTPQGEK